MNLLSALYWWNPLSRSLQHKVDVLLELHVDEKIIHKLGIDRSKYIATLLNIADSALRASHNTEKVMPVLSPMVSGGLADLGTRTEMMYKKQKTSVPLMLSLLGIIICIYIGSYCYIFNAHYVPKAHTLNALEFSQDNIYAIELENGTYDIYCNNFFLENTDTLEFHNNIPVVTQK